MRNNNLIIFNRRDIKRCVNTLNSDISKNIDLLKITTSAIIDKSIDDSEIKELVGECKNHGVNCYIGGGITEKEIKSGNLGSHIKYLQSMGIEVIELSNNLNKNGEKIDFNLLINNLKFEFDKVFVEIGSKLQDSYSKNYKSWEKSINETINTGVDGIILEGGLGNVGIYDYNYQTKTLLLIYILKKIKESGFNKDVIIETNTKNLQYYIISLLGKKVKLGNIYLLDTDLNFLNFSRKLSKNNDKNKLLNDLFELIDFIFDFCKQTNINPNNILFDSKYFQIGTRKDFEISKIKNEILLAS